MNHIEQLNSISYVSYLICTLGEKPVYKWKATYKKRACEAACTMLAIHFSSFKHNFKGIHIGYPFQPFNATIQHLPNEGLLSIKSYNRLVPRQNPPTILPWCTFFLALVITPFSTRSTRPSENISVWTPMSRWAHKLASTVSGMFPIPVIITQNLINYEVQDASNTNREV